MLGNHAPLVVAEQFELLDTLYPGRIDLVMGRRPGGLTTSAPALRRAAEDPGPDAFEEQVKEVPGFLGAAGAGLPDGHPYRRDHVHVVPAWPDPARESVDTDTDTDIDIDIVAGERAPLPRERGHPDGTQICPEHPALLPRFGPQAGQPVPGHGVHRVPPPDDVPRRRPPSSRQRPSSAVRQPCPSVAETARRAGVRPPRLNLRRLGPADFGPGVRTVSGSRGTALPRPPAEPSRG